MIICKTIDDLQQYLQKATQKQQTGFIPTMGALHEGHLSLIRQAKANQRFTVCSIFVNPTQFNDPKDFEKYPVTVDKDIELLTKAGVDILFLPTVAEMYPQGTSAVKHYDLGYLETVLEGEYRPGHFQGVCQIVHRLLTIVQPGEIYMGQKDYQQCMVVRKLIELENLPVQLHICPTQRETDGLAMSSRNVRLTTGQRTGATAIYQALLYIKDQLEAGPLDQLKKQAASKLASQGFRVDYVEIAKADTLTLLDNWNGRQAVVVLVAAYYGEVRLIDNILLAP